MQGISDALNTLSDALNSPVSLPVFPRNAILFLVFFMIYPFRFRNGSRLFGRTYMQEVPWI